MTLKWLWFHFYLKTTHGDEFGKMSSAQKFNPLSKSNFIFSNMHKSMLPQLVRKMFQLPLLMLVLIFCLWCKIKNGQIAMARH